MRVWLISSSVKLSRSLPHITEKILVILYNIIRMTTASIPRFLLPRGEELLRRSNVIPNRIVLPITLHLQARNASTSKAPKPKPSNILEKPEKFNPPSHPARLVKNKMPRIYGTPLSQQQKEEQKKKKYPNMMPPEGTFMHWFLTNKGIHIWISMGVLTTLAFYTLLLDFLTTTPYTDLLPARSEILSHPIVFFRQYLEVYRMHTAYISAQTAERRRHKVEDVQKRSAYRKAHGMEDNEGFGGWTARRESEALGPAIKVPDLDSGSPKRVEENVGVVGSDGEGQGEFVDIEGRKRVKPKKWFGIWE
ncbi:hypothetical protein M501DRAFT_998403 [Patellaria atrata CBS 101060]|uniref:Uncharacterized protein n=1 Tax=Patellaria atrata CBS 101060 TaxID=1346257 RepID=A0A9P4SFW2_9PEZI|nr:hypothetical protein M501DRAFT_998403 [Patellaria atrata CBS 101060]